MNAAWTQEGGGGLAPAPGAMGHGPACATSCIQQPRAPAGGEGLISPCYDRHRFSSMSRGGGVGAQAALPVQRELKLGFWWPSEVGGRLGHPTPPGSWQTCKRSKRGLSSVGDSKPAGMALEDLQLLKNDSVAHPERPFIATPRREGGEGEGVFLPPASPGWGPARAGMREGFHIASAPRPRVKPCYGGWHA